MCLFKIVRFVTSYSHRTSRVVLFLCQRLKKSREILIWISRVNKYLQLDCDRKKRIRRRKFACLSAGMMVLLPIIISLEISTTGSVFSDEQVQRSSYLIKTLSIIYTVCCSSILLSGIYNNRITIKHNSCLILVQ